jgi:murein DD-endopeptidase MepM/ murein hydrolase activator NlpD
MPDSRDEFERRPGPSAGGPQGQPGGWRALADALLGLDSQNHLLRYASHALLIAVGVAVIWLAGSFARLPAGLAGPSLWVQPTQEPTESAPEVPASAFAAFTEVEVSRAGVYRLAQIHTDIPSRPRNEIQQYTVQPGDTLFGIAQKFGLTPETVIWSNRETLEDDPHSLRPGMEFLIPPVNGVLYQVKEGDTLQGIADGTFVTPADIVDWPGNQLDPDDPQIAVGQYLMIPGGTGKLFQWEPPVIRREAVNVLPVSAGAGACPGGYSGAVGGGFFIWPSDNHYLSGTDFTSYHAGIDIAAGMGQAIYASDSGVAVFAGPNNYGFGNLVIIDHGNGWQTLYAHLSQWNVSCGQSISQGQVLGLAGSTGRSSGPHLHYETSFNGVRINPWSVLPGP